MRSKLFNAWKALGLVPSPWALDIHRFIRSVPWAVVDCWLMSSSNSCIINELFTWLHFIFPIERFWRQGPWHLFFPCLKHLPLDCLEWNLVVKQSSANFFSKEPGSEHSRLMGYRSFSQLLNSAESPSPMSDSLWLSDCIVHGILQARRMEWVAFPFSRGSSQPRDQIQVTCIAGRFFTSWAIREAQEYWRGQPIPSPVDLSDPGIKLGSSALQADSLPTELSGSSTKTATDSMQTSKHGNAPKNFVYKQVTAQIWAVGHTLPPLVNSNGNRSQTLGSRSIFTTQYAQFSSFVFERRPHQ